MVEELFEGTATHESTATHEGTAEDHAEMEIEPKKKN